MKKSKNSISNEEKYARKILEEIKAGRINTPKDLDRRQFELCKKFVLTSLPSRPFILSFEKHPSEKVLSLLLVKPVRSISGVQMVAVMLPPAPCPGECIYCPSPMKGKSAPRSYTGYEPSALRGQRLDFDPYKIVSNRILQLDATGNKAGKIELIFQGGSFTSLQKKEQERVVKRALDAITKKRSSSISESKINAEKSKRRVVGITFETRPDLCKKKDIRSMLSLGATRVELGVQNPENKIYEKVKRGHTVEDVTDATKLLKDSSLKVLYHLMPGLPGSNYKQDLKNFKRIFSDPAFKPDMVKFYPCLVIKGSPIYEQWKKGRFSPIEEKQAIKLLTEIKSSLPKWVRVMRVNRDIPSNIISGGVKRTNLRQEVHKELARQGKKCNCIRCREAGIKNTRIGFPKIRTISYNASGGEEIFISSEYKDTLYGFVRLRVPSLPFMKQINENTALIRELHVYGRSVPIGEHRGKDVQHKGIGKALMQKAEEIAKEKFGSKKMVVISGLGVREYYHRLGYKNEGPYVSKKL